MKHNGIPRAIAKIWGGSDHPQLRGTVKFFPRYDGLILEAEVFGLPRTLPGFFGFHIHQGDNCRGAGFPNTGSHYDPGKNPHPSHAGDLPPLLGNHGMAYMQVFTDRLRVEEIIGRTVIIHSGPDDFSTQPAGNAGEKIACGVIEKL